MEMLLQAVLASQCQLNDDKSIQRVMTGKERMIVDSVCVRFASYWTHDRFAVAVVTQWILQRTLMPLINRLEPGGKRKKKEKERD